MGDDTDLARRAVACKAWRWMPGMIRAWSDGGRNRGKYRLTIINFRLDPREGYTYLPALTDPATLGCLLALVRDAWGPCSTLYCPVGGVISVWWVVTYEHNAAPGTISRRLGVGPTEAAALVAALEAAQ